MLRDLDADSLNEQHLQMNFVYYQFLCKMNMFVYETYKLQNN